MTTTTASGAEPPPAGGVWLELRECESGDNYQTDTGNGFYGAYQFAASTWSGLGLSGVASQVPYWEQDEAAANVSRPNTGGARGPPVVPPSVCSRSPNSATGAALATVGHNPTS